MALTFGTETAQYDGYATDGDPGTGQPQRYGGPQPGRLVDGPAYAISDNTNGAYSELHLLASEVGAVSGPNATEQVTAHTFNKTGTPMSRQTTFLQRLFERFRLRRPSVLVNLVMHPTIAVGPASVRAIVWLRSQAGVWVVQHQYNYEFGLDAATGQVVVKRNGAVWKTVAPGVGVDDVFRYKHLRMPQGDYSYQSELNVQATADGRVEISASMSALIME